MRYPARDTAPFWARFHGKWFLGRCKDVPGDVIDTAVLIVSELVTNAYTAAVDLSDPAVIDLSLRLFAGHLLIEVIDSSPEYPVLSPLVDACIESGRGLQMVNSLSAEWGYFFYRDRKVVYCFLQVPAPEQGTDNAED